MRVLTTAKPNTRYDYYENLKFVVLEARLINGQIIYYETHTDKENKDWECVLKPETIKSLFSREVSFRERPFLLEDNHEFWIVFTREKHHEAFLKIKNKVKIS